MKNSTNLLATKRRLVMFQETKAFFKELNSTNPLEAKERVEMFQGYNQDLQVRLISNQFKHYTI